MLLLLLGHCCIDRSLAHDCHHDGAKHRLEDNLDGFATHVLKSEHLVGGRKLAVRLHLIGDVASGHVKELEQLFAVVDGAGVSIWVGAASFEEL